MSQQSQSGIHVCYAGYIRRGDQNFRRSGAAAWRTDRHSWRSGATAGVAEGCGVPKRKFLMCRWRTLQDVCQVNTLELLNSYKINKFNLLRDVLLHIWIFFTLVLCIWTLMI